MAVLFDHQACRFPIGFVLFVFIAVAEKLLKLVSAERSIEEVFTKGTPGTQLELTDLERRTIGDAIAFLQTLTGGDQYEVR